MKIYKLSAYQLIPQNPSSPADPSISLQNMQNAQGAIGEIDKIIDAANQVNTALTTLEDTIGNEIGLKQIVSDKLNEALAQNDSVKLLMQMNLLPSISSLFNSGDYDRIKIKITNDVQQIQNQQALDTQNQNQQSESV